MGNYCKTFGQPNHKSSQLHTERLSDREMDDKFQKSKFRKSVARRVIFKGVSKAQLGGEMKKVDITTPILISELVRICSRNRPEGVSDDNWQRFLSFTCSEYFNFGINGEFDSQAKVKSENFSVPVPRSSSRSSVDAVMDMFIEEGTPSSSLSTSVSIAEFAGRFALPDVTECNQSDAESSSIWLQDTECSYLCEHRSLSVRSHDYLVSADEVGAESYKGLNSKFTAICLGDLPSGSCEENLFYDENKISTIFDSCITESGVNIAEQVDLTCGVLVDDFKVNLQITRAL